MYMETGDMKMGQKCGKQDLGLIPWIWVLNSMTFQDRYTPCNEDNQVMNVYAVTTSR